MGGRGASGERYREKRRRLRQLAKNNGNTSRLGRTAEQDKAVRHWAKRTANLKKEQLRIIDDEGNVILQKHGSKGEVATTHGEKMDFAPHNIVLHNHPSGGTFSPSDLRTLGYRAKELVVASPEGTYRLINPNHNKSVGGWVEMQEAMEKIEPSPMGVLKQARAIVEAKSPTAKALRRIDKKEQKLFETQGAEAVRQYHNTIREQYEALQEKKRAEVKKEEERLYLAPYHEFMKNNASKYGYIYIFEKNKKNK